jgi:3-isopropylmalate/(R)-2-methylmalate dehydratase small subunit
MAEPYGAFTSRVVALRAENVDTDQIVPARYLKVTDKAGLAEALFRDWRFEEDGTLKDPPFVLDRPEMAGRRVLLVGDNFGAGSSREHAPWALAAWGIRAILSTSFADIFRNNSLKNGLLPVIVDEATHAWLLANPGAEVSIDLETRTLELPTGLTVEFPLENFARYCLMNGVDELGFLLARDEQIEAYEKAHGK